MTDVRQFGDRTARSLDCGRCEAMLADAVDGVLTQQEQQFFETHLGECEGCVQLLAEARRGAAWLEMLRTPAPEPSPMLLEKILAQTSGMLLHTAPSAHPAVYGNVLPFPRRAAAVLRGGAIGRLVFEPRLAMTAAMAFLSIALTLDLMGVNPLSLRAGDFSPSGLHRSFADANARVVQYYEGLRVVYELESRVHDFEDVQQNARDADAGPQPAKSGADSSPASQGAPESAPEQDHPAAQPSQPDRKSSVQPKAGPKLAWVRREDAAGNPRRHTERTAA